MGEKSVFVEKNGFFAWCRAKEKDGGWEATVTFESAADHAANKTSIRSIRHRLLHRFPTRDEAMQAAIQVADQRASEDDTGL